MSEERLFTPFAGRSTCPALRAYMKISEQDMAAFDALPQGRSEGTVDVFDTVSQRTYRVRRASCGGSCYCAAEIAKEV